MVRSASVGLLFGTFNGINAYSLLQEPTSRFKIRKH